MADETSTEAAAELQRSAVYNVTLGRFAGGVHDTPEAADAHMAELVKAERSKDKDARHSYELRPV